MLRPPGTVWCDTSRRALADKGRDGAASYERRFKRKPDTCWLCAETVNGDGVDEVDGMQLVLVGDMPPFHFWFGRTEAVEEAPPVVEAAPEPPAAPQQAGVLICHHCGAESLDPHARACWACGYRGG